MQIHAQATTVHRSNQNDLLPDYKMPLSWAVTVDAMMDCSFQNVRDSSAVNRHIRTLLNVRLATSAFYYFTSLHNPSPCVLRLCHVISWTVLTARLQPIFRVSNSKIHSVEWNMCRRDTHIHQTCVGLGYAGRVLQHCIKEQACYWCKLSPFTGTKYLLIAKLQCTSRYTQITLHFVDCIRPAANTLYSMILDGVATDGSDSLQNVRLHSCIMYMHNLLVQFIKVESHAQPCIPHQEGDRTHSKVL